MRSYWSSEDGDIRPRSELEHVDVAVPGRLPEGPLRRRLHDGDVLPGAGLGVAHLQPPDQTLLILEYNNFINVSHLYKNFINVSHLCDKISYCPIHALSFIRNEVDFSMVLFLNFA